MLDLIIRGGDVVTPQGVGNFDVAVLGERIAAVAAAGTLADDTAQRIIDASGKIFHTGIALSPAHFVHCSGPQTQISSLRTGDRLYSEHWDVTFLAAKRP